ncbi:MAG: glutathione S-transferase family protein [Pseudomonadota bacterium]
MTLRLHWSPDSANLVIRMALESFGLPYDQIRIRRDRLDHRKPDYLELNPQGLLPVLEDGELVLFETAAILLHLCDRVGHLRPDGAPSNDAQMRAAFLKWLFYLSNTLHADLRVIFYPQRYLPDAPDQLRRAFTGRFVTHLDLIERSLPEQGGLAGPITMLEVYLACQIRWALIYPQPDGSLESLQPWPRIELILSELEARPAIRRACEAEHIMDERPFTRPSLARIPAEEIFGGSNT